VTGTHRQGGTLTRQWLYRNRQERRHNTGLNPKWVSRAKTTNGIVITGAFTHFAQGGPPGCLQQNTGVTAVRLQVVTATRTCARPFPHGVLPTGCLNVNTSVDGMLETARGLAFSR